MATYTQYYSLDKYEGTDRPNLRDQYNAAMDKIDNQLHTQAGNIASAATAAAAADTKATQAAAAAATASTTAAAAASSASQALEQLNGLDIRMITSSDFNSWFEIPSDSYLDTSYEYEVEGVSFATDTHATMVIYIHGRTRVLSASDFDHYHPLFKLKDWKDTEITDTSVASMVQYNFPVELHLSSSNPDTIRFVTYSGGGTITPPQWGFTISACMILQLVPKV